MTEKTMLSPKSTISQINSLLPFSNLIVSVYYLSSLVYAVTSCTHLKRHLEVSNRQQDTVVSEKC